MTWRIEAKALTPGGRGGYNDVESEKSGRAEGVGVWGQSPRGEGMLTIVFNIDTHVDIHLSILICMLILIADLESEISIEH